MAKEIQNLWREVRELSLGTKIDRLDSPPSPVKFLRDYVSQSKPCVISNAISHWPALKLWSDPSYLTGALSDDVVSLHLTPNGCADAVTGGRDLCFASAHVEKVLFPEALKAVQSSCKGLKVGYLQQQNDCFRTEYSTVALDCDGDIEWATEAFGCSPEAVNLWIGTDDSVTSFHKDHYENLYAVVSGEKHFLLLPPTDVHRLYIEQYPAANYSYHRDTEVFKLEIEEPVRHVPWSSVDPYPSPEKEASERLKYSLFFNGPEPFHCTVKAGEILYLPSMWFHHVSQTPGDGGYTIAVNYWYDMQFDIKYAYFNFLQSLSYKSSSLNPILSWREDEDRESSDAERNSDKNSGACSMVNSFSGVPNRTLKPQSFKQIPFLKTQNPHYQTSYPEYRTPCCLTFDILRLLDCLSPPGTEDLYSSLDQESTDTCNHCWGL